MTDELNVLHIMKAIDIFDRLRQAMAAKAAIEVRRVGGDGGEASVRVLRLTDDAAKKWWMSRRLQSLALLDRAAWMAHLMPSILQSDFELYDFNHEAQAKEQLIKGLGRALVAMENHAESVWFLRGNAIPRGPFSQTAEERIAIAGPTTWVAYLIASYVKELQLLPADQFARLLHESKVTGRAFMADGLGYVAHHMDPSALVDATLRGFMLGHELAIREPSLDEQSRREDFVLTPQELRQLAFYGQRSFKHSNLFALETPHESDPIGPTQTLQIHEA